MFREMEEERLRNMTREKYLTIVSESNVRRLSKVLYKIGRRDLMNVPELCRNTSHYIYHISRVGDIGVDMIVLTDLCHIYYKCVEDVTEEIAILAVKKDRRDLVSMMLSLGVNKTILDKKTEDISNSTKKWLSHRCKTEIVIFSVGSFVICGSLFVCILIALTISMYISVNNINV